MRKVAHFRLSLKHTLKKRRPKKPCLKTVRGNAHLQRFWKHMHRNRSVAVTLPKFSYEVLLQEIVIIQQKKPRGIFMNFRKYGIGHA